LPLSNCIAFAFTAGVVDAEENGSLGSNDSKEKSLIQNESKPVEDATTA
jgi:hypothetical protein